MIDDMGVEGGGLVSGATNYFLKQSYENHTAPEKTTGQNPHTTPQTLHTLTHSLSAPSSKDILSYPPSLSLFCRQAADRDRQKW